jgi:hypothetical protein
LKPDPVAGWTVRRLVTSNTHGVLEQGTITIGGTRYLVSREALMSGAFFPEANGKRLVTADKPSAFHRSFTLQVGGKSFTLKAGSAFGRSFVLTQGDQDIGFIAPLGLFGRKAKADLPDDLKLEVRAS